MRNLPPVIGISGYAQTGKDTIAGILHDLYGYEQVSFAAALRDCLLALDPWVDYGDSYGGAPERLSEALARNGYEGTKKHYPEYRRLLQVMGTEVGRQILGEDIWVETAFKNAPKGKLLVFADMRFPNEWQSIVDRGGEVWRVDRPGVSMVNAHISETALDQHRFDQRFYNEGSIKDLADKVIRRLG